MTTSDDGHIGRPSHVMSLRKDRESTLQIPVDKTKHVIEITLRTEIVKGRPVIRYYLPDGAVISHGKK